MRRRIAVVLALLIVVALPLLADVVVRSLALGRLRTLVENDLAAVLGLPVSIRDLELSVVPAPHLEATGVRVANLPERREPHLLAIEELEIGMALWPLLRRQLVVDSLSLRGVVLDVETDEEGGFELPLALPELVDESEDPEDPFELHVRRLRAERLEAFLIDGPTGSVRSLRLGQLDVEAEELDGPLGLVAEGELDGTAFALEGRTGSLRELLEPTQPFPVRISGSVFDAEVEVEGTLAAPFELEGLDLGLTLLLPDLALAGWPLPDLGPIAFVGRLSDLDGSLGLHGIDVETLRSDPLEARIEGSVGDLRALREVAVTGDVEARNLGFLEGFVGVPLPESASAELHAELSDADGSLGVVARLHAETADGGVSVDAEGGSDDVTRLREVDVAVQGRARDLATLAALVEGAPELPRLGPVVVSGRLRDREGSLAVDALRIELGSRESLEVLISGSVGDVVARTGVALAVRFSAADPSPLETLLGRELPPVGRVAGSARISDADGSLGLEDVRMEVSGPGEVQLALAATFDDLFERDEVSLSAQLRARDLAAVGALAGVELPAVGPVDLTAQVRGSDESFAADDLVLRVGETRIAGRVSGSLLPGERTVLRASIESPHVRLQDLGIAPESEEVSREVGASDTGDASRGASSDLLPFDGLRTLDLDLDLRAGRITGVEGLDVLDSRARVRLQDGDLRVEDVAASYQRGRVEGELGVDASRPEPELSLRLDARAIDLHRVMSQFEDDTDHSGLIDLGIELRSRGRTQGELLANLEGTTLAVLREGTTASTYARRFVVNLADVAFPRLRTRSQPRLGCVVADLEIEDGIATVRNLVLEEGEITVTGSGRVDLLRGVVDLELVPSTTNPGIVSMAPRVLVDGPLADPRFHPVKRTLASSIGRGLVTNVRRAGGRLLRPFRSRSETVDAAEAACADVGL